MKATFTFDKYSMNGDRLESGFIIRGFEFPMIIEETVDQEILNDAKLGSYDENDLESAINYAIELGLGCSESVEVFPDHIAIYGADSDIDYIEFTQNRYAVHFYGSPKEINQFLKGLNKN